MRKFSLRKIVFKSFLILLLLGCQSQAKLEKESNQNSSREAGPSKGKLTMPNAEDNKHRLGLKIKIFSTSPDEGAAIARKFEEQLSIFEPCLRLEGKSEVVRLKAAFSIAKNGLISNTKIIEQQLSGAQFTACFLKQIEQLDLDPQPKGRSGELELGTYYGPANTWDSKTVIHE